jgi:hypothetical protein
MKAILIDPKACTVTLAETDGKPASIAALIAGDGKITLDSGRVAEHGDTWDYAWVTDNALTRGPIHAFRFDNRDHPWGGRAVIVGIDKEKRELCDVGMSLAFVSQHVEWIGLIDPVVTWKETEYGTMATVSYTVIEPAKATE